MNAEEIRVLVIASNAFSDINNNGKTLKSIFSSFPKESLFNFYLRPEDNSIGDGNYAASYYAVSEMDIIKSIISFSSNCGGIQHFPSNEPKPNKQATNNKVYSFFKKSSIRNNKLLRRLLWKTKKWNTKELWDWCKSCKPDIVFSLVGGVGPLFDISQEISDRLDIPLAIYFTDDYILHTNDCGSLSYYSHGKNIKAFKEFIDKASKCYCIGDLMCEEYGEFFNKPFSPIMNSVDVIPFSPKVNINKPIIISYFGGLSLGRWEMISRFSDVVKEDATIKVYTTHEITDEIAEVFSKPNIEICGKVVGEELERARMNSDFLLHVENDKQLYRNRTSLSISTKIPESLIQSRMLIGFGPSEVASMQLIQKHNIGLFISSEISIEHQRDTFLKAISNKTNNREIVENAYKFAREHFDKRVVSHKLKQELIEVCNNSK